jgi:protocatechuate 3,4-dioxygenase beta subunit
MRSHPSRFTTVYVLLMCGVLVVPLAIADDANETDDEPARAFVGTVVDEAGAPVAGALVEWGRFSGPQSEREFTFTDANGEYRLETTRAWQDFRLSVHKAGYGPRWVNALIPARESSVVDFVLPPASAIEGVVVDPNGEPIPGVTVHAQIGEFGYSNVPVEACPFPGPRRVATTNEQGEFVIRDLAVYPTTPDPNLKGLAGFYFPSEDVQLTCRYNGKWLGRDEFLLGHRVRFQVPAEYMPITPETAGCVQGIVIDAATLQPITQFRAGVRDRIVPEDIVSADGVFVLSQPLLKGIEYQVEVFAPGYAPGSARIAGSEFDSKPQVVVALERHPSIDCEVVDAVTGNPLPGVAILSGAYHPNENYPSIQWMDFSRGNPYQLSGRQTAVTDERGRATFCDSERPHTFFILHEGYARTIIEPEERDSLLNEDKTLRIELRPESRIAGRIVLPPIPGGGFRLNITRDREEYEVSENYYGEAIVNESGEFQFDRIGAGTYRFEIIAVAGNRGRTYWRTDVKVADGEQLEVEFGLPEGPHTLRGLAAPFAVILLIPHAADTAHYYPGYSDADGQFEITGIPAGIYRVRADAFSTSLGDHWERNDYIEITGDTERDFTAVPIEGF